MKRPNFLDFRSGGQLLLVHSAKGSTWDKHKYIKRVDGTYYYPESYEGGRHLPDGEEKDPDKEATKVFDEFESFSKDLMKKNGGNWDPEQVAKMSKEELGKLYEDMTGVKLGSKDLDRLFNSREAKNKQSESSSNVNLSEKDVENLANEIIRGNFGNGQVRKDLLGDNYQKVQSRVNEILKSSTGQKKVSKKDEETEKKEEKKTSSTSTPKTPDMKQVYSVYSKKKG